MRNKKDSFVDAVMDTMMAQFGGAVKAGWVYDGDLCPCCLTSPITEMMYSGQKALSINAFMYRERGVMIAYLLCGQCAQEIVAHSKNGPTSLHESIEKNLVSAYLHHLSSVGA